MESSVAVHVTPVASITHEPGTFGPFVIKSMAEYSSLSAILSLLLLLLLLLRVCVCVLNLILFSRALNKRVLKNLICAFLKPKNILGFPTLILFEQKEKISSLSFLLEGDRRRKK